MKQYKNTAIVLAAGQGKRMHSDIQKQFLEIQGRPVLFYSLDCFQKSPWIHNIIIVTGEEMISYCREEIVERYGMKKVSAIVSGGKERYDSVYKGLLACEESDYVFIHDGARPFLDSRILRDALETVRDCNACVVGMPVKDTIKIVGKDGFAEQTPDRSSLWMIQTPQVFNYTLIKDAYQKMIETGNVNVTDDAMVLEQMCGQKVKLVEGSYRNIKITTPEDLLIAEAFLTSLRNAEEMKNAGNK